jgi:hypothetical protein
MGTYSINRLERLVKRAEEICDSSDNDEIDVAGEEILKRKQVFIEADRDVVRLLGIARKERKESDTALGPLATKYDTVRSAVVIKLPHQELPGRSSSFTTPDDLITAAEKMEDLLVRVAGVDEAHPIDGTGETAPTGEAWALKLLRGLQPLLGAGVKEYREAVIASADLQKSQQHREVVRTQLEQTFLEFRRLVRDVYGDSSREYHMLRTRSRTDDADEETTVETEPSPTADETPGPVS